MAGKTIEYRGLTFEYWEKSLRVIKPAISPVVATYQKLEGDSLRMEMDSVIDVMNTGVKIIEERKSKVAFI
jgi:hypothetical protein